MLPADPLFRIVRNMPAPVVSFEEEENHKVNINGGSAKYNLFGLAGEDFPSFPDMPFDKRFSLSSNTLTAMLEKTMFAAARKETNSPNLSGVFFEATANNGKSTISMVATDGHRLAMVEAPATNGILKLSKGIIIPLKGCAEILRLSREEGSEIELSIAENSLLARKEDESLVIRLLEGSFPNYRVVTSVTGKVASSERKPLEECLERTLVMAQGISRQVSLNLQGRDRLVVTARNQDLGDAQDSLAIRSETDTICVCFNPNYLLEGLRAMKSREVEILFKDAQSPARITGKEDEGFSYIVMPMRG
jgi:DNA polymerase III subunit beta